MGPDTKAAAPGGLAVGRKDGAGVAEVFAWSAEFKARQLGQRGDGAQCDRRED
jgi:hypothetical protein